MIEGWLRHRLGTFALDVRWSLEEGKVLALFGPSGAGKSTTLHAIAGLLRPDSGRIAIGGTAIFDSEAGVWVPPDRRGVGFLPQQLALFPHLTAWENVAFGLYAWRREERERRVRELLELLHVAGLAARRPAQLSVGQQQRVALARALAPEPKLLILDEPFSALDETLRRELRRELRALRDRTGIPMVLVSHDLADVLALADRVIVIEHGRVVSEGSPMDVLAPRQAGGPLSRLLEVENVFEGTVIEASQETGVMRLEVSGVRIVVPYGALTPGVRARVGLRAGDILVATARPHGLSAQNALAGTVRAVERRGYESEVSVDCGPLFRAEVTPRAVETLGLALGKQVWLVFKSNSCFLIE